MLNVYKVSRKDNEITIEFWSTGFQVELKGAFSSVGKGNLLNCKCDRHTFKSNILLLTCATIHLELVPDLSVESFIGGFKRFAARRGTPSLIISDNAKTFRAKKVKSFMSAAGIQQKFILFLPHRGGVGFTNPLWGLSNSSLRKILGLSYLTYKKLRPSPKYHQLTATYINEDDLDNVITPNHLIFGTDIHNNNNNNKTPTSAPTTMPMKRLKNVQPFLGSLSRQHTWTSFDSLAFTVVNNVETNGNSSLEMSCS